VSPCLLRRCGAAGNRRRRSGGSQAALFFFLSSFFFLVGVWVRDGKGIGNTFLFTFRFFYNQGLIKYWTVVFMKLNNFIKEMCSNGIMFTLEFKDV
jgi:hypothetical protein